MQRLVRVFYPTDASDSSPGTISGGFSDEGDDRRVVSVDWSVTGRVEVTFLVTSLD